MTEFQSIRRRPDGSIDTEYYLCRGRARRGTAAHDMAGAVGQRARKRLLAIAALASHLPFLGALHVSRKGTR